MKKIKLIMILVLITTMVSACTLLDKDVLSYIAMSSAAKSNIKKDDNSETITISKKEYEKLNSYKELDEISQIVKEYFYKETDEQDLLTGAKRGLLNSLNDPYTFYYTPDELAKMWDDDRGEYVGIGILISSSFDTMESVVSRVFRNTPAEKSGILKKDVLIRVEDLEVNPYTINDAVDLIRGEVGKDVEIEIRRGEENLVFVLTREDIHVNPEEYMMLTGEVGYIAFYQFTSASHLAFTRAKNKLISQGAKGLIIDLRDNPGGWLTDVLAIADEFIDGKKVIAYMEARDESREYYYSSPGASKIPLVVIINEHSASAAELLAGALQDYDLATLVGVNTFGKGVVQNVLPVGREGAGMQLTTAQYFTPLGNPVHEIGITPDIEVNLPEGEIGMYELGDLSDIQLVAALEEIERIIAEK